MAKKEIKITNKLRKFIQFIKDNLLQIFFLILVFQVLETIRNLPYINIITSYQILEYAILGFVAWFLFYTHVTNKLLLSAAMISFLIAIPTTFLKTTLISDILGFISFILLCSVLIQRILTERKLLRISEQENE